MNSEAIDENPDIFHVENQTSLIPSGKQSNIPFVQLINIISNNNPIEYRETRHMTVETISAEFRSFLFASG
jgi:hypothetical protein